MYDCEFLFFRPLQVFFGNKNLTELHRGIFFWGGRFFYLVGFDSTSLEVEPKIKWIVLLELLIINLWTLATTIAFTETNIAFKDFKGFELKHTFAWFLGAGMVNQFYLFIFCWFSWWFTWMVRWSVRSLRWEPSTFNQKTIQSWRAGREKERPHVMVLGPMPPKEARTFHPKFLVMWPDMTPTGTPPAVWT